MRLVIAEKPSVAQALSVVIGAKQKKGRLPGGERLARELVHRPSGRAVQRGKLRSQVCQMAL